MTNEPWAVFKNVRLPGQPPPDPFACLAGIAGVQLHGADASQAPTPRLVGEVIPSCGVGTLVGESKIGKTFLAIALAKSLATGSPFLDRWPISVQQGVSRSERDEIGLTVFVAGEGRQDFEGRLMAGYASLTNAERLRLRNAGFPGLPIVRLEASDLARLSKFADFEERVLEVASRLQNYPVEIRLEMVVIDTLSSVFNFSDDNAASSVQPAMNNLLRLAEKASLFILNISHPAKGGRKSDPRGSSVLFNSSDVVLTASKRSKVKNGGSLGVAKVRDRDTPSTRINYVLQPVAMQNDARGVFAAPANIQEEPPETASRCVDNKSNVILEIIEIAMMSAPKTLIIEDGSTVDFVRKENVRKAFFNHGSVANTKRDTRVKYFNTALRELVNVGEVEERITEERRRKVHYIRMGGQNRRSAGAIEA